MFYPMMMYPSQNQNMTIQMPTQTGDKDSQQKPMIYMMPVCFMDPSKMPKDMKMPTMPNMPFQFAPYPMSFPQNNQDSK